MGNQIPIGINPLGFEQPFKIPLKGVFMSLALGAGALELLRLGDLARSLLQ